MDDGGVTRDPAAPEDGKAAYAAEYKAEVTATAVLGVRDDGPRFAMVLSVRLM